FDDARIELAPLRTRVPEEIDIEWRRQQPVRGNPWINALYGAQALHEERGGDEQRQSQRKLQHDEEFLRAKPAHAARTGRDAVFQRGHERRTRGSDRRDETEYQTRHESQRERKHENAGVEDEIGRERKQITWRWHRLKQSAD